MRVLPLSSIPNELWDGAVLSLPESLLLPMRPSSSIVAYWTMLKTQLQLKVCMAALARRNL